MQPTAQHHVGVLPPGIRTYKPRRGRVTARQQRGLDLGAHLIVDATAAAEACDELGARVVCEIGFGTGEAAAALAAAEPGTGLLAVDVHTPGVGDLLMRAVETPLRNVRVVHGDALEVLAALPDDCLTGVRTFFPDPWPKARHHKRRLVQPAVLDVVARVLRPGGWWHLATDWTDYVEHIVATFAADPRWSGGVIDRPATRPVTRYESIALREGRAIRDLRYVCAGSA